VFGGEFGGFAAEDHRAVADVLPEIYLIVVVEARRVS
jgi:hypothetical protein